MAERRGVGQLSGAHPERGACANTHRVCHIALGDARVGQSPRSVLTPRLEGDCSVLAGDSEKRTRTRPVVARGSWASRRKGERADARRLPVDKADAVQQRAVCSHAPSVVPTRFHA